MGTCIIRTQQCCVLVSHGIMMTLIKPIQWLQYTWTHTICLHLVAMCTENVRMQVCQLNVVRLDQPFSTDKFEGAHMPPDNLVPQWSALQTLCACEIPCRLHRDLSLCVRISTAKQNLESLNQSG